MARPFIPRRPVGPSIGQGRKSREQIAREKADAALAARGFVLDHIERADGGVVAIAINGQRVIAHLGRDQADALYNLAALTMRPEGRA